MKLTAHEILTRLGNGERIVNVCASAGLTREQFDAWWREQARQRVPSAPAPGGIELQRDSRGIPHIHGKTDRDLFFGYGFAVAQDRLFQLDFLRRKALGRLAEVVGPPGVESDVLSRTLGLPQLAQAEWETLGDDVRLLL